MSDVPALKLAEVRQPPNEDIVRELRKALAHAEAGQLRGIALAGITDEGKHYTMHHGDASALKLIGVMRLIEHEMLDSLSEPE